MTESILDALRGITCVGEMGWRVWQLKNKPIKRYRARRKGARFLIECQDGKPPVLYIKLDGKEIIIKYGVCDFVRDLESGDIFDCVDHDDDIYHIKDRQLAERIINIIEDD